MQKFTIKEALENYADPDGHCIYVYRDGNVIFYVGRSIDPLNRLLEHMGTDRRFGMPSAMGILIKENMPDSLNWRIETYTLEECAATVQILLPDTISFYMENLGKFNSYRLLADYAEDALIEHFRPCVNAAKRHYYNPLPDKYNKHLIANEGVKQSQ